ncbi:MAG: elongation factor P maturation arginine rhamnosyltransferase EarP [Propionivibrio sp.]
MSDWDIFCNVIDNYGDIGVCWRLARQLAAEHGFHVRLWVDELGSFQHICPQIAPSLEIQTVAGIEIRRWDSDFFAPLPGDVVVEAFACRLPEKFVDAMAARSIPPVWINLDYLSAEAWVSGCHGLPSPHPQYSLNKFFFFPGFEATTGGLIRERDLETQREAFHNSPEQQKDYWHLLQQKPPAAGTLAVSLFSYENPALADLLSIWAEGSSPVCCFLPATRSLPAVAAFTGSHLSPGEIARCGNLELRILPFVPQPDYDRLLWSCDINFVRGEDSFVRAQWAAKPMVWQIYPQDEGIHLIKLNAFLDQYCAGLPETEAQAIRKLFVAWNDGRLTHAIWNDWIQLAAAHFRHAINWEKNLRKQEDLCTSLVRFCRSKL